MCASGTATGESPEICSATKMPCWKPRCASCGPATMSPTAQTCATEVRSRSSVTTKPRSSAIPASSYPSPAVDGSATDGDEQVVRLERLAVLQRHGDRIRRLRRLREAHTERVGDASPTVGALERLADRRVLHRHQMVERLDDRHLCAERSPDARELDADDAAAEHDHAARAPPPGPAPLRSRGCGRRSRDREGCGCRSPWRG